MIEVQQGRDYFLKEMTDGLEFTTTKFHGLIGGVADLSSKGYIFNLDTARVKGSMYIVKVQKTDQVDAEDTIDSLKKETTIQKGVITKLRKKVEKLEGELKTTEEGEVKK